MFNSYSSLPMIPYNILKYIALEDEIVWKMMKYNDYKALSKPDLKFSEKMDMIWKAGPQEKYNAFFTNLIEDAIPESKCIMKIYDSHIQPKELFSGVVIYCFEFLYGGEMSLVDYEGTPVSRGDLFINRIMSVLNGADVNGVGRMTFCDDLSRYVMARSVVGNSKNYTGVQIFMATMVGDTGLSNNCEV